MSDKKDPRPKSMPWVTPYLSVQNVEKTTAFYEKAFGFKTNFIMKDEQGEGAHGEVEYPHGTCVAMVGKQGAYGQEARCPATSGVQPSISLYVYCDDVDALHEQAVAAGAKSLVPPTDMFWGDRMCALQDNDGHHWSFAYHTGKEFDPKDMCC